MATSDRNKRVGLGKTGRFPAGSGTRSGGFRSPKKAREADETEEEEEEGQETTEEEGPLHEDSPSAEEEESPKTTRTAIAAIKEQKLQKREKKKIPEQEAAALEPITDFPRGWSIGVKFAGLSAVVVAFFMVFLGLVCYSMTDTEVDAQITKTGVTAVESFEKAVDKAFWVCPTERIKEGLKAAGVDDAQPPAIQAFWSGLKVHLQKGFNDSLDRLVKGSEHQIVFASIYEGEPTNAVAMSSDRASLSGVQKVATIGRVEVYEGSVNGHRTRRFDKPIMQDASQVAGASGAAFISVYMNAEAIDEIRANITMRIALVTILGTIAGVGLTVLISNYLSRPIRALERDMINVAEGDLDHETEPMSHDEIGALAHTFNIMTRNLKAAQNNAANQKALERELSIATEIQTKLLPERIPQIPGLDIHSFYLSAKEVGGDYYDFIVIDQTHLGIIVADVSGKGIPGSMVMTMARSLVRLASVRNISPADTFKKVNRILAKDIRRGMFVTSMYMVLNVKTHEMKVASAGHNPLVVFRAQSGEIELVKPQGIALGFDKGTIFDNHIQEVEIKLELGDRIVAFTDGVNEAMSPESEEFGDDRFYDIVKRHAREPSKEFVNKIVAALEKHRAGGEQSDDITITTLSVVK